MTAKKTASEMLESAMEYHLHGDPTTAVVQLQDAIFLKPDFAAAWNNRGCILKQLGNNFDAVLNFDRAIAADPKEPNFYNNRGAALADLVVRPSSRAVVAGPRGAGNRAACALRALPHGHGCAG